MTNTLTLSPTADMGAPAHYSKLSLILLGLAAASLIADFGLLVGAVLIH